MGKDKYTDVEKPTGRYKEAPSPSTRKDRRELDRKLDSGKFELVATKKEGFAYLRRKKSVVIPEKTSND